VKTADLRRQHGISRATLYAWNLKIGDLRSAISRKYALEDESRGLKRIVADQALNIDALKIVKKRCPFALRCCSSEKSSETGYQSCKSGGWRR